MELPLNLNKKKWVKSGGVLTCYTCYMPVMHLALGSKK